MQNILRIDQTIFVYRIFLDFTIFPSFYNDDQIFINLFFLKTLLISHYIANVHSS